MQKSSRDCEENNLKRFEILMGMLLTDSKEKSKVPEEMSHNLNDLSKDRLKKSFPLGEKANDLTISL
jgi:hypothetical protein